jgi:fumarate hydratase class I
MAEIRADALAHYPVKTRLSLTGPMVVARDIAHAKIKERSTRRGLPQYLRDYCRLLRRPGQDARGLRVGLVRPDHRGPHGLLRRPVPGQRRLAVMLAKGNRSKAVTDACKKHGGFYLGSIGGPAARLAQDCITKVEVLEYPSSAWKAVWKIEVVDFPAFIVVDDKGNDFFRSSSISVTSAAIGDRSLRISVTWANSGWPLSFSMTAATPSCRPTRRLSRWATSWVSTTREPARSATAR